MLAWLDGAPKRYKTYVGNRIATVTSLIPSSAWKHVPTQENPADCASRGLTPRELKEHDLWWNGPPWLYHQPIGIPKQPNKAELCSVKDTEAKPLACHVVAASPAVWLEHKFSSLRTLLHDSLGETVCPQLSCMCPGTYTNLWESALCSRHHCYRKLPAEDQIGGFPSSKLVCILENT